MPTICYQEKRFGVAARTVIDQANSIIAEYAQQGFDLTLRQLYYQFVSRDLLPNRTESYKRLGSIVNDARLAGEIDWSRLVDRTRGIEELATWSSPQAIVAACAEQFRYDLWSDQPHHPEVWIEKEALAGVFEGVCNRLRVSYLSCRGYTSQSEMWRAGQRLKLQIRRRHTPVILHFGDHDPSGIDMTRDIEDRLTLFVGKPVEVRRLALNMDQIHQYEPPPNPAKTTDARYASYEALYGEESWELDALEPAVLSTLVEDAVAELRDDELWDVAAAREQVARDRLLGVAESWEDTDGG